MERLIFYKAKVIEVSENKMLFFMLIADKKIYDRRVSAQARISKKWEAVLVGDTHLLSREEVLELNGTNCKWFKNLYDNKGQEIKSQIIHQIVVKAYTQRALFDDFTIYSSNNRIVIDYIKENKKVGNKLFIESGKFLNDYVRTEHIVRVRFKAINIKNRPLIKNRLPFQMIGMNTLSENQYYIGLSPIGYLWKVEDDLVFSNDIEKAKRFKSRWELVSEFKDFENSKSESLTIKRLEITNHFYVIKIGSMYIKNITRLKSFHTSTENEAKKFPSFDEARKYIKGLYAYSKNSFNIEKVNKRGFIVL